MEVRIGIDDGRKEMMLASEFLDKHGLKGVFYIAPFERACDITIGAIKSLADRHEVGGHTMNHIKLTTISLEAAKQEIEVGKEELENIIGKRITKFASPRGWHNDAIVELIKNAGFKEHRTTKTGVTDRTGYDDYHLPCTVHFYPRPEYLDRGVYQSIIDKFEEAKAGGGYFNVLAHTDELTRFSLWGTFNDVLAYIKANQ